MPFTITREFAQKHGFKIDAFSNPNVAYKGDKNKPDEWHYIGEPETRIIELFFTEKNALEYQRTGKTYVEVDDEEGHIKGLALVADIKDVFFDCGNRLYMEIPKQATRFIDAVNLLRMEG